MPAALEEYAFRLKDDGIVLNPDGVSVPFVDITDVVGLDSAEVRQTERDWEGNDGTFMDAEFEKGRGIVLTGTAYCDPDNVESYMDALKGNWAPSTVLVPFYFKGPGAVERLLMVKPLGLRYNWQQLRRTGQTSIQFQAFAEDPRIYGAEELTVLVAMNSVSATGFAFPFDFPLGFGSVSSGSGTNLVNHGNRSTPTQYTITGPTTNPRIVNDDLGQEMKFIITLTAGELLVVDTKYRTVRLDGAYNRRGVMLNPSWFDLQAGDNHIRYLSDVATSSTISAKYRSAWR